MTYGTSIEPVFVGGLMRSGTTLTRVLLSQHPSLYGTLETHWFTPPVREGWGNANGRRIQLLRDLVPLSDSEYAALCVEKTETPEREFIDIVMAFAAQRDGKPRWIDKTPDNIANFSLIGTIWERPRLVHVTREYKDVFASWKHKRDDTLTTFLAKVETAYDDVRDRLGTTDADYLEIDYEALVFDTKTEMRRAITFLGETWDPRCESINLTKTQSERQRVRTALGQDNIAAAELTNPISADSVGQWRELLSAYEAREIDRTLAPLYDIFGERWRFA